MENLQMAMGAKCKAGKSYRVAAKKMALCGFGLHASERAIDALNHAPGAIVCRVWSTGKIIKGTDKYCSSVRKVIWMGDATKILHLFACKVAEKALLAERKAGREPDRRLFEAILTKRNWIEGKATDEELTAARSAAWSARSAARSAAESEQNELLTKMLEELAPKEIA